MVVFKCWQPVAQHAKSRSRIIAYLVCRTNQPGWQYNAHVHCCCVIMKNQPTTQPNPSVMGILHFRVVIGMLVEYQVLGNIYGIIPRLHDEKKKPTY